MKKTLSFLTAILMTASAVSCSTKDGGSSVISITAEKLSDAAYIRERIELPAELRQVYFFDTYNGGADCFLLGAADVTPTFRHCGSDFTSFDTVEIPDFEIGAGYSIGMAENGTIVTLADRCEKDEEGETVGECQYVINTFSPDGKLLSSNAVSGDYPVEADDSPNFGKLVTDGKFLAAEINGTVEIFDTEGRYYGELMKDASKIAAMGRRRSGGMVFAVKTEDERVKLCTVDDSGKFRDSSTLYDLGGETIFHIMAGTGGYDLFIVTSAAIYGITDDSAASLFDIKASSVKVTELKGAVMGADGDMRIMASRYDTDPTLRRYTQVDPSEIEEKPVLTVGHIAYDEADEYFTQNFIDPWNEGDNDFTVQLKPYVWNLDTQDAVIDDIAKDAISGNLPDILFLSDNGYFGYVDMVGKGAVADLYEYIDKDSRFSRDSFIPSILKYMEYDGRLPAVSSRFRLVMGVAAKEKWIGREGNWDIEKRLEYTINPPIETVVTNGGGSIGDTKDDRADGRGGFGSVFWQDWVDMDNDTCDFESDTFIRFLKWCNEGDGRREKVELDPDAMLAPSERDDYDMEEENRKQAEKDLALRDDKQLFDYVHFNNYQDYVGETRGAFGDEPITFIDEPELIFSGTGKMAINMTCQNKDMAWEYISSWLTDRAYDFENNSLGFPVTKSALKLCEEVNKTKYYDYSMYDDTFKDYEGLIYSVGFMDYSKFIKLGKVTDNDIKAVNDMIDSIKPHRGKDVQFDEKFSGIAEEELDRYFSGGCTAEECAKVMQNRISTYLSERYS